MLPSLRIAGAAIVVAGLLLGYQEASRGITAEEIRAHTQYLAQDELRGRAPGSRGGDLASDYIRAQFREMGLQPLGGSYFQEVPLVGVTPDPATIDLAFEVDEGRLPLSYPSEAVIWPGAPLGSPVQVAAELVFVGYGIHAPEWSWDDYDGRDVSGKVVVILIGDPPAPPEEPDLFDGPALTYYGRWTYKYEEARRRGAAGALLVHADDAAGYGWSVVGSSWTGEQLVLPDAGDDPPVVLQGWITQEAGRKALGLAGLDLTELYARAARRDFAPVRTGITVRAGMDGRTRTLSSRNVVAYRPGTSAEDVVMFTAHYDHLGVGPPVDGDSIYNGAYDNASGVALLLEVAEAFAELEAGTRRGTVFMATTAEEAGLLGASHYVHNPLVPLERTLAVINVDGANLWGETDDVVPLGAARSNLGRVVQPRADELGLQILPDPQPAEGAFFRSDHFAFARAGIPVLYIRHGLRFRDRPEGWGARRMEQWAMDNYHQPSDEYHPELDFSGAVQQARLVFGIGYDIADSDFVPEWDEGSPFR
ncbi:MAG: M28 family peptidase [Longimicrobiales bacterium]|nr:M28 family peptidase [Longimicrobiales bacterium]